MNAHRQREPELPTGTLVAGATVDGIQASGSTAVVYRGHHDGDLVAIKVAVDTAPELNGVAAERIVGSKNYVDHVAIG